MELISARNSSADPIFTIIRADRALASRSAIRAPAREGQVNRGRGERARVFSICEIELLIPRKIIDYERERFFGPDLPGGFSGFATPVGFVSFFFFFLIWLDGEEVMTDPFVFIYSTWKREKEGEENSRRDSERRKENSVSSVRNLFISRSRYRCNFSARLRCARSASISRRGRSRTSLDRVRMAAPGDGEARRRRFFDGNRTSIRARRTRVRARVIRRDASPPGRLARSKGDRRRGSRVK